jgi:predicted nucleic acid-binding protein
MAGIQFQPKSLVADTSSLIYLAKSSIIRPFLQTFHVIIPPSVFRECVQRGYAGSDEINGLREQGQLLVQSVRKDPRLALRLPRGGEREVIALFYQLGPDGVLIDDGDGVKVCRSRGIPFVSALLIPSLLLTKKALSPREAKKALEKIIEVGRYSRRVILFAREVFGEACSLQN